MLSLSAIGFTLLILMPVGYGDWAVRLESGFAVGIAQSPSSVATIKITPQRLNASSNGDPLDATISLTPYGCPQESIVFESITPRVLGGSAFLLPVDEISENKNKSKVRFDRQQVIAMLGGYHGRSITFEVRGEDQFGCQFTGTDTIGFNANDHLGVTGNGDSPDDLSEEPTEATGESVDDDPAIDLETEDATPAAELTTIDTP